MLARTLALALLAGTTLTLAAQAAELKSISRIAFGSPDTLFVADWKEAQIAAITLPPAEQASDAPFNMLDLDTLIRAALGTADLKIEGIAKRPGTSEVYLALSVGPERSPAVLVVTPDGKGHSLDLTKVSASTKIEDAPEGDFKFWGRTPLRSFTVTDMKWHDGKLFVAGLSNQTFSSSLRIIGYPFGGKQSISSIAMYHTSHNQLETRAPIREMAFATINGQDTLVAAYLCTPLVTVPVASLKDGAHVEGKTISELGYGNYPTGMVSFTSGKPGHEAPYILITNALRSANLIPVSDVAKADAQPGLSKEVPFGSFAGASGEQLPFGGLMAIDNQNDKLLVVVRSNPDSGRPELVSYDKSFNFRVSDFVSEYDFPGYKYAPGFQANYILPVVKTLSSEEGVADKVVQ